ncbi:MAG: SDH family Clp fold serine proteinase [Gammaproteobacteria bacterium]
MAYITGDRPGLEAKIATDVVDHFSFHLDSINVVEKITLFLYTRGGDTLAAWSLANLLRLFCNELEVVVPSKCHSAGTLMALGTDRIVMTKQAMLGPIDPSITTPLNPKVDDNPNSPARASVSVEAIKGYIQLTKEELGIKDDESLAKILAALSDKVHPLVLGQVIRTSGQIKMLAERLLRYQVKDEKQRKKIVGFLSTETGSHDYTINRREALGLGLNIEKPDEKLYLLIKQIYEDIREELCLTEAYDPNLLVGEKERVDYAHARGLVESVEGGTHRFVSEGVLFRVKIPVQVPGLPVPIEQEGFHDNRKFEGWKHEKAN